jgi:hypothetical protein
MKKLLLVLILLATAGSVFAADLKVTGDMTVRGTTDSETPDGGDTVSDSFFDYDLNLNLALVANENATVFTKLTFDKDLSTNGATESGETAFGNGKADAGDAVLEVERAYLNYKFAPFAQLNAGLMGGGQWATTFGDREINVMRVQAIGALSADMIFIATYEKNSEGGSNSLVDPKDNEKLDTTTYYLSSKMKFGAITLLPLLAYGEIGTFVPSGYEVTKMGGSLGVNGDFGIVGLESEFIYATIDWDGQKADDYAAYGAYVNVFAKLDPAKVGVAVAYGSSDEKDGSFEFGDDFDFTIVADDLYLGAVNSPLNYKTSGLVGMTVGKLYGEYVADKLTVGGAFAYGMSTDDKVTKAAGADITFWEIDASVAYAFDANASYTISFGYAAMEVDTAEFTAYRLQHAFAVKF